MSDMDRNDKYVATASQLATEISPERDLWPGIAEGIARPRRSRGSFDVNRSSNSESR